MISIIIPTKNEPYVNQLIKEIHKTLNQTHEILVVDKSESVPKIKAAKLIRQKSNGLGKAMLEGLAQAKGEIIVLMDADGSHRPQAIPKLVKEINGTDIVIGSRFIAGGKTKDKTHRRVLSFLGRKFASFWLNLQVEDPMSGFSAVKREVYDRLSLNPLGYKINMELIFKAKKAGYRVKEVPITFLERKAGKTKFGFGEAFRILKYLFELKVGLR